jgi:hypothetical protein
VSIGPNRAGCTSGRRQSAVSETSHVFSKSRTMDSVREHNNPINVGSPTLPPPIVFNLYVLKHLTLTAEQVFVGVS